MSKTTNFLDVLFLDGFSWTDLVDMLEVPHYTNEHRGLVAPRMYEIRSVKMPDLDDPDQPLDDEPEMLFVVWSTDRERPTDDELRDWYRKQELG